MFWSCILPCAHGAPGAGHLGPTERIANAPKLLNVCSTHENFPHQSA